MATLETQYKQYMDAHPTSKLTFKEWEKDILGKSLAQAMRNFKEKEMTSIDLHGVKHEEVLDLLDKFIWENMKKNSDSIMVITGNSEGMKKIVQDIANDHGTQAEQSFTNTGALIIPLK